MEIFSFLQQIYLTALLYPNMLMLLLAGLLMVCMHAYYSKYRASRTLQAKYEDEVYKLQTSSRSMLDARDTRIAELERDLAGAARSNAILTRCCNQAEQKALELDQQLQRLRLDYHSDRAHTHSKILRCSRATRPELEAIEVNDSNRAQKRATALQAPASGDTEGRGKTSLVSRVIDRFRGRNGRQHG